MGKTVWHKFESAQELAETLASDVAERLASSIAERGTAVLAVSGGSTPPPFFRALSHKQIDWRRVIITLVDERFVPASSERSNARLVYTHLLKDKAAQARFVGLYHEFQSVEEAAEEADQAYATLPLPLDVVILGMGTDGHTASFFPDADGFSALLDPEGVRHVLPVHAVSAQEPRLTLSLAVLRQARFLALHIEGTEKLEVLRSALEEEGTARLPIRHVADEALGPLRIYWAPPRKQGSRTPPSQIRPEPPNDSDSGDEEGF
ncbi:6-phosphogluconolactonase [Chelativorans sp. Marseille-P2723]|uniref:6-phosphogluconolactonase n=1 Tax=Chelativorans sp. Marseille-P2723 TaxID=2709133 RepID=UPI00157101A2|nr:6-phosphogluconolactonase [Chelativorans sp. Marseille-P2723]